MKTLFRVLVVIPLILQTSCQEDFNLKTNYVPKYALNCIIRGDTTYHTATLLKSYDVDGFDPFIYTEDSFISNADIRMWHNNNVYFFRDTLSLRSDTSRFNFLQKYYYINNFNPASDDVLEIKAVMDNGKVLQGVTRIPKKVKWDTSSTTILRPGSEEFFIFWENANNYGWTLLRLQLNYRKGAGPTQSINLPVRFDGDTPIFPTASKHLGATFKWSAFDRIMRGISEGEDDKEQFRIFGVTADILIFDDNLSRYYANMNGYMDDFTIRVDQNDYSNIEGGFGIFGSYIKQRRGFLVDENYIFSLGYRNR
jgi:hypothetical protein